MLEFIILILYYTYSVVPTDRLYPISVTFHYFNNFHLLCVWCWNQKIIINKATEGLAVKKLREVRPTCQLYVESIMANRWSLSGGVRKNAQWRFVHMHVSMYVCMYRCIYSIYIYIHRLRNVYIYAYGSRKSKCNILKAAK